MPRRKTKDKNFTDLTQEIDLEKFKISVKADFADFPDPRKEGRCIYPAWYLLTIILAGYLAGCDTVSAVAHFGELRASWFADMIEHIETMPSYDTLWWFLARVKPEAFKELISRWLKRLPSDVRAQLLVIDGKRLRGVSDSEHIVHITELFAAEEGLVIAQEKVPDKAGERQALPALLDAIDISGALISMDALYAHLVDIKEVTSRGADYMVGIKGNQGNLESEVMNFFEQARTVNYDDVEVTRFETHEKDHGRIESRHVCVTNDLDWLPQRKDWQMQSLIEVRSTRLIGSKEEKSIRYYGSSRKADAKSFAQWIRTHWSIENDLHYVMDVVFAEDAALNDAGHSAENISLIRRLALNIIKMFDPGRGITDARRSATYQPNYLRGLLGKVFIK